MKPIARYRLMVASYGGVPAAAAIAIVAMFFNAMRARVSVTNVLFGAEMAGFSTLCIAQLLGNIGACRLLWFGAPDHRFIAVAIPAALAAWTFASGSLVAWSLFLLGNLALAVLAFRADATLHASAASE